MEKEKIKQEKKKQELEQKRKEQKLLRKQQRKNKKNGKGKKSKKTKSKNKSKYTFDGDYLQSDEEDDNKDDDEDYVFNDGKPLLDSQDDDDFMDDYDLKHGAKKNKDDDEKEEKVEISKITGKPKRKYKTRHKMEIDENEHDDFSNFGYILSDANLNLNHQVYPSQKFRGIAKSGRRWRARTCINGKTQYGVKSFFNPWLAAMEYDRLIRANRKDELSGAIKTNSQIILNFPYGLETTDIRNHKLFEKELQKLDHDEIKAIFGVKYRKTNSNNSASTEESSDDESEDVSMDENKSKKKKNKKKKKKKKRKKKEEPIIDNDGLQTKIPYKFLAKMNSELFQTERLKPFGPTHFIPHNKPIIRHYEGDDENEDKHHKNQKKNKNGLKKTSQPISEKLLNGTNDNDNDKSQEIVNTEPPKNIDDYNVNSTSNSMFFGYETLHLS